MGRVRRVVLAWVLAAMGAAAPVRGDEPQAPPAKAPAASERELFDRGRRLYKAGAFAEAAQTFEEGYRVDGRPLFLYNAAQAYRRAGQPAEALRLYRRYLEVAPQAAEREEVQAHIVSLEAVVGAAASPTPPPAATSPTTLPAATATPPPQGPVLPPPPPSTPEPPPRRSSHVWWWVAGAAVLAAAATGAALAFTGGEDPPATDLGNYRLFGH